jgi:hypothetical protein
VRPYLEKTYHKKRADGMAQSVGPEFNPSTEKKKNFQGLEHFLDFGFSHYGMIRLYYFLHQAKFINLRH